MVLSHGVSGEKFFNVFYKAFEPGIVPQFKKLQQYNEAHINGIYF